MPTLPILVLTQDDGAPAGGGPAGTVPGEGAPPTTEEAAGLPPTETGTEGGGGSLFGGLAPFLIIGVIFWVLLIAPERKNRKRQEAMRNELKKGDDVMTNGGMFGRVVAVDEEKVTLQIADGVRVKFVKQAIQGRVGDELAAGGAKKKGGSPADDPGDREHGRDAGDAS